MIVITTFNTIHPSTCSCVSSLLYAKKSIIPNINVMIALLFFIIHNLDVVTFDEHLTSSSFC